MLTEYAVRVCDETSSGDVVHALDLILSAERVKVRDIIEARVRSEVCAYNEKTDDYFHGLVCPSEAEKTLNGYKMRKHAHIDANKQIEVALEAFKKNGFFMLINDRQAEDLDEVVYLKDNTTVSFIKLTQLVGG